MCSFRSQGAYFQVYGDPNLWYRTRIGQKPNLNQEELEEALRTTQFGKCIFKCDNDVVDHQVVNLEFENGATASFNMCSFNKGGRRMRIMGTEGEIWGAHGDDKLYYFSFKTRKTQEIRPSEEATVESIAGGHGGGDDGIVNALYDYIANDIEDGNLSEIGISVENHLITFAAEQARLENRVVDFKEYAAKYLK